MRLGLLFAFIGVAAGAWGQPAAFEVASVKFTANGRNAEGYSHSSLSVPSPGTFSATNGSLEELIRWAYQVRKYQISGPAWLNDDAECFDVAAKAAPGATVAQMRVMLQTLLADRFKLALHRDTKMLPIYELVAGKNGSKLKEAKPGVEPGSTSSRGGSDSVTMTSASLSMQGFADFLSRQVELPVFDKTGIAGNFAITLEYGRGSDTTRPSLFSALQETLGLKLEAAKGPVETLVIDHIEKAPTDN